MPDSVTTERGTRITYPDSVTVDLHQGRARPGMRAAAPPLPTEEGRRIAGDVQEGGLELVDAMTIRSPTGARGMRSARDEPLVIEVETGPGEGAVLLVESNGVYSWRLPDAAPGPDGTRAPPVRGPARFTLGGERPSPGSRAVSRNVAIDWIMDKVADTLRTYVFKFAIRQGAKLFVKAFEALTLDAGPIAVTGFDPTRWTVKASPFRMPTAAPGRVLLFIHGTFSTTRGSFGALAATPEGRAFLSAAYKQYGAVVGFDHSTLALDPEQNAKEIFEEIKKFPPGTQFDAVAFSRGALVTRVLIEELAVQAGLAGAFRRVAFVGCTNAGTHLAEPENLEDVIDLYTNVVAAGARAISLIPGAAGPAAAVSTVVRTLGNVVRYLAETAITDRNVPGLAAMEPDGALVTRLNGAAAAKGPDCYAVVASFKADLGTPGFTQALLQYVGDRVTDRIFKKARNDMVVHTSSMSDLGKNRKVREIEDFGETSEVYHTIYFANEQVARKLTEWLLDSAPLPQGYSLPAAELEADMPLAVALPFLDRLDHEAPVLIRRKEGPAADYFYVRRVQDFADLVAGKRDLAASIRDAFALREFQSAMHHTPDGSPTPAGIVLAPDARVGDWMAEPADEQGDVVLSDQGVVGIRLPDPAIIPVSGPGPFRWSDAISRGGEDFELLVATGAGVDQADRGAGESAAPGATLGEEPPPARPGPKPDEVVTCDFAADMPPYPKVGEMADLVIEVSREAIDRPQSNVSKRTQAPVRVDRSIHLRVIPRRNCRLPPKSDDDPNPGLREVKVPDPGQPVRATFQVTSDTKGPAEVLIEARQGPVVLVTMVLEPVFVVTDEERLTVRARAGLLESTRADRLLLRIYEHVDNGQTRLRFLLDSSELNRDDESESLIDLTDFIEQQYKELERSIPEAIENEAAYRRVEDDLRHAGNQLWTHIVPKSIRHDLWAHRNKIAAIQVISQEPYIPWEIAVMSGVGEPMEDDARFLCEFGLTRWVQRVPWPGPHLRIGGKSVRYVAPNYADDGYKLQGTDREIAAIKALFADAAPVPARARDVESLIKSTAPPEILHFICHGETRSDATWKAELLLEGDMRAGRYEPESLKAIKVKNSGRLRGEDGPGSIVFLNACRVGRRGRGLSGVGGFADAFLNPSSERGASVFVGPMWNVKDETAVIFARTFYEKLCRGGATLIEAVNAARQEARKQNDPTWLAYSVYGDPFARIAPPQAQV